MQNKNKLVPKKNGSGVVSSYTLNISLKEAKELDLINPYSINSLYSVKKEVIDGKLVISRGYPQTIEEFVNILNNFGIVGKHLSPKTLLDLLYFIEGDSQNYFDQKKRSSRHYKIPR